MGSADYDLIVIGSGPAGHHAAIQAAKLGRRVAIIERRETVGGVCINTGAIPSKSLREAVLSLSGYRDQLFSGWAKARRRPPMSELLRRCTWVVQREVDVFHAQFARNGVDVIQGVARFVGPNEIEVARTGGTLRFTAENFVIAVGTKPAASDQFPIDGRRIVDADSILQLAEVPLTMVVVGGGVVGVEYACMFAALGTKVTLLDARQRILEFVDREIAEALMYHMRDLGVTPRLGEEVTHVEADEEGVTAFTQSNKRIRAHVVLYAVGRQGATDELNLEAVGLKADSRGRLKVDERMQTEVPGIYAAGDVIGFPSLAGTSMEQGRVAACNACGIADEKIADLFPYGIYTIPEISFIGRTEEQLTEEGVPYEIGIAHYRELARANIIGDMTGRLKILFHRETEELLGVHAIGEGACELVHIGQAVMLLGGTIRYFEEQVFNYPTLAEAYKVAALNGLSRLERFTRRLAA